MSGVAFTSSIAQASVVDWEGVADDQGNPIGVTPEAVDALLAHYPSFDALDRLYLQPVMNPVLASPAPSTDKPDRRKGKGASRKRKEPNDG